MNRPAKYALIIGVTAACASAAGTSSSTSSATNSGNRIIAGPNVRVSAGRPDEAHYETHAAAHPDDAGKIIVTAIIYPKTGRRGTIVYSSADGGKTWQPSFQGDDLENTGDPAVAYGPDGTGYFTALTSRGHPLEVQPDKPAHNWDGRKTLLYRLPRGALKWEGPASALFADREYVVVDDTKGRFQGRLYLTGDPRPNSGFVVFTSTDGGRSFPPGQGAEADVRGASMGNAVVASDGTLIGVFADERHTRAAISTDGGRTLLPTVVIDTFVRAGGRKDARHNNVNHFMTVAIDRSKGPFRDRIYATWPDRRSGHSRVWLSISGDRGRSWSKSRIVVDNPPADTTDQFMPTVAVNRDGVVGLMWYDRRDNPDNKGYYPRFIASTDGGETWLPSVRLSAAPFSAGAVSQQSAFGGNGGDTAGLATSADGAFHPVWVDDRTGIPQVWTSTVTVQH